MTTLRFPETLDSNVRVPQAGDEYFAQYGVIPELVSDSCVRTVYDLVAYQPTPAEFATKERLPGYSGT